jgi:hypothetical protein
MRASNVVLVASVIALVACERAPHPRPSAADVAPRAIDAGARIVHDAAASPVDAGPPRVLTIRIVNAGAQPMTVLTNPDTNEIVHTRHLRDHPQLDASLAMRDGELVKFFTVGQEPLCSSDAGAGYGGLGQPAPRTLAPNEAIEFVWDGQQRHEVVMPERGVCQEIGQPEPGRYRFEFDQPYDLPNCRNAVITWPLAPDAPRVIELRCIPRPQRHGEEP